MNNTAGLVQASFNSGIVIIIRRKGKEKKRKGKERRGEERKENKKKKRKERVITR